jgi:hypothetical protein
MTALDDGDLEAAVPERVALVAPGTPLIPLVLVAVDDVVDVDVDVSATLSPCTAQQPSVGEKKKKEGNRHTHIIKSSRTSCTMMSQE